jgi:hypothetical protein
MLALSAADECWDEFDWRGAGTMERLGNRRGYERFGCRVYCGPRLARRDDPEAKWDRGWLEALNDKWPRVFRLEAVPDKHDVSDYSLTQPNDIKLSGERSESAAARC